MGTCDVYGTSRTKRYHILVRKVSGEGKLKLDCNEGIEYEADMDLSDRAYKRLRAGIDRLLAPSKKRSKG